MGHWTASDVPDLSGRVALITGANSGIGLEAAKALAARGCTVVLACRDPGRAQAATTEVKAAGPSARVEPRALDLASLASVRAFAAQVLTEFPALDLLINNAGVMAPPLARTVDGFELQLGTNHLGHFALTGLLLGALEAAPAPRVVNVSSNAHRMGRMRFEDLNWEKGYSRWGAYGQSKLANLHFTYELERRLRKAGRKALAVACHPGYSSTNLFKLPPGLGWLGTVGAALMGQPAWQGSLPTLYAATHPEVRGGEYVGPDGLGEWKGYPKKTEPLPHAKDAAAAAKLWELSEQLTGVRFAL
jgi:NAD(P)-dependent dehydrogenase (short-subunit alcohol dehydrogenase family)